MKEEDFDKAIELMEEGFSYADIAKKFKVGLTKFKKFIKEGETRSARVREALDSSADTYADMAEQVLKDAPRDPIEMQRARELAQHYRWKAKVRRPKDYGDRVQNDVTITEITSRIVE